MKKILSLALPLIISQLISVVLVLTDIGMMAKLSVADLAAGGLGASVYSFVFLVASSMVGCVANLIAIAYGQSLSHPEFGQQKIRLALKGAVMLSVILAFILMLSFRFAPELLLFAKQPKPVISVATDYLDTLKWAILPSLLLLVLRGLTSTLGNARSVMFMSLATVILNIPVSYFLAFVLGWGIRGLGAGTAISAFMVFIGYSIWVFAQEKYYRFAPWLHLQEYSLKLMNPLLAMGLPIALATVLEHALIYGGTLMAGMISIASLALHQILLLCLSFTWSINLGLSQAAAILVGKDFGAGNFPGIKATCINSFILVSAVSVLLATLFMSWPDAITTVFLLGNNTEDGINEVLTSAVWVVALCFIADAWQLLAINLLRGMKIVVTPTVLTAIGYWLFGIPAAWLLMKSYGLAGIWGGIGIGLGVTSILLIALLISANKRHSLCNKLLVQA